MLKPDTSTRPCQRCGKKHIKGWVWLEFNGVTLEYVKPGQAPEGESQGLFPFGRLCAKRQLHEERAEARKPETFNRSQIIHSIQCFLDWGEKHYKISHTGYFSGDGFAARALRYHMKQLEKEEQKEMR